MDTRQLYIYLCINICPVLTQHGRGVATNVKLRDLKSFRKEKAEASAAKLQSVRTQAELELPATNATRTMAACVPPAGALMRKATDSH